ncbi:MAG: cytochrome c peroxidase, partial [Bacteroidota bacterium]
INHIEVQPLGPISNTVEMGENIGHVITKLQRSARYRNLFGSDEINSQNMLKAMAQFMGMLYSYNSKYDQVKKSGAQQSFTGSEFHGYQLFLTNCNGCHKEPLFSDFQFRSNGLKVNPALNDSGRAHITGLSTDKFKFKTPSLRNIALTAPYMHDGRFENLDSVLNYYTRAFENTQNLDALLPVGGFQFSATDKKDIINFFKTLSDTALINNTRFKDPKHF